MLSKTKKFNLPFGGRYPKFKHLHHQFNIVSDFDLIDEYLKMLLVTRYNCDWIQHVCHQILYQCQSTLASNSNSTCMCI